MSRTLAGERLWFLRQLGEFPSAGRSGTGVLAARWWAASAVILLLSLGSQAVLAATLNVPADYPTIQAAINSASSGDLVEVDIGTYRENIILRDDVDVQSIEAARTFLIAQDDTLAVVAATNVNNILFAGFTFTGSTNGVFIVNSGITLANNIFDSLSGAAVIVNIGLLSDVEIINNVFWGNNVGIDRFIAAVSVTNNIFAENIFTIVSNADDQIDPNFDVSYNCFYRNDNPIGSAPDGALGDNFQTGDPRFVDIASSDFHLQQDSVCIDAGIGTDIIDDTVADMGAYGGDFADAIPFPVAAPTATDSSTSAPDVFNISLDWPANLAYLISDDAMPGSYNVWYQRNQSGPPYEGTDAGNGTIASPITVSSGTSYTLMDLQPDDTEAPGAPVLVSAAPQNKSVVLDWNAAAGATAYEVHYGVAAVTENTISVGDVTRYTVTGLNNGTEYIFSVGALTQPVYYLAVTAVDSTAPPKNESDYSPEVSIAIGDPVAGLLSSELTAIPEEVVPYPDLPDKGCFVATAAFGANWVAEVQVLREFRDRYLVTHAPGRSLVIWYYRHGPVAAKYLDDHAVFKPLVRAILWPLVALAAFMIGASVAVKVWVALLTAMLVITLVVSHRFRLRMALGKRAAL